jgi:hypothetical protein
MLRNDEMIRLSLDDMERARWQHEAERYDLPLDAWVIRVVRHMLDMQRKQMGPSVRGRPWSAAGEAALCRWCGRVLPTWVTVRRRYCSDVCRVQAWRSRQGTNRRAP